MLLASNFRIDVGICSAYFTCEMPKIIRHRLLLVAVVLLILFPGCSTIPGKKQVQLVNNPLQLTASNEDAAWERTIDVLHEFLFEIERENRQARTIETKYKVGSGILEPWHKESVGWSNRLESTLQSLRRKVIVTLSQASPGAQNAYVVQVVALKEMEDLDAIAANSPGGATFQESTPLSRDLNQTLGQSRPSGWIPQGRDFALEQAILRRLQKKSPGY